MVKFLVETRPFVLAILIAVIAVVVGLIIWWICYWVRRARESDRLLFDRSRFNHIFGISPPPEATPAGDIEAVKGVVRRRLEELAMAFDTSCAIQEFWRSECSRSGNPEDYRVLGIVNTGLETHKRDYWAAKNLARDFRLTRQCAVIDGKESYKDDLPPSYVRPPISRQDSPK